MKHVPLYTDLAFCFLILPLLLFAFPVERWWATRPLFFGTVVVWLYATYFLYKYFIVPRLFHGRRQRLEAVAVMVVSVATTFFLSTFEFHSPYYHLRQLQLVADPFPVWGMRPNQQAIWLHYIIVVTICFAMATLTEAYRQRLARRELEYERNKAELALYKAQIDPHFLFNTLNTLYGLLITRSEKTEAAFERFITLTKYMYSNASRDFIPIGEEVEYIDQYIGLQRLRLDSNVRIVFEHEVEHPSMQFPPMLLITFVENAFKYGISSSAPCFVHIRLRQHAATLCFEVENSVCPRPAVHSRRTGIDNCRRRLALVYPRRHRLTAELGDDKVFRVNLEIQLQDPCSDV